MNKGRYTVDDYVVLNDKFISKVEGFLYFDYPYFQGAIVEIIKKDTAWSLYYHVKLPVFLGDFVSIYINDTYIDHEATTKLNKDKL